MNLRCLTLLFAIAGQGLAQGEPIAIADRRDHVFDPVRRILYVTTARGVVERYDVDSKRLLAPIGVSTSLYGCDLTPDASALYVCDGEFAPPQGFLRRIDLATGNVQTLPYDLAVGESHGWDIAIADNGKALFTANFSGSGWVPLRELNLATGAIVRRTDAPSSAPFGVRNRTRLEASPDRASLFVLESDISSGPVFTYDAATDGWPTSADLDQFNDRAAAAVGPQGGLLAIRRFPGVSVVDRDFGLVTEIGPGLAGYDGLLFDPVRPRLYLIDTAGPVVSWIDTDTWLPDSFAPIGDPLEPFLQFDDGMMSISSDGALLFISTSVGLRMIEIGRPAPRVERLVPDRQAFEASAPLVTIEGRHFSLGSAPDVQFGGVPASGVTVLDDRTLQCRPPAGVPGPVDVAVINDAGRGSLLHAFSYTPALRVEGEPAIGESFSLRVQLAPTGNTILMFFGLPPRIDVPTPPFGGTLQIGQPLLLFAQPFVLPRDVEYTVRVPNDPSFEGVVLLFQPLVGDALALSGAWTNSEVLQIRAGGQ